MCLLKHLGSMKLCRSVTQCYFIYPSSVESLMQEMVAEKESLMAQYQSIAEQTAVIEQAQKPLLQESNEIKKQVGEFDGRRQEAQVRACPPCLPIYKMLIPRLQGRVTQAAEQRLAAQNQQQHWAKKLLDEEKKVRAANPLRRPLP